MPLFLIELCPRLLCSVILTYFVCLSYLLRQLKCFPTLDAPLYQYWRLLVTFRFFSKTNSLCLLVLSLVYLDFWVRRVLECSALFRVVCTYLIYCPYNVTPLLRVQTSKRIHSFLSSIAVFQLVCHSNFKLTSLIPYLILIGRSVRNLLIIYRSINSLIGLKSRKPQEHFQGAQNCLQVAFAPASSCYQQTRSRW